MNRIKLLCAILLIIIAGNFYQGVILSFIEGVKYGFAIAKYETDNHNSTDDFLLMEVVAKDVNYLDSTEINNKTGQRVLIRSNNISLIVNSQVTKPLWWNVLQVIYGAFILSVLILGAWILALVIKILFSLQKSEVFDRINLKRINRIGLIIITIGLISTTLQLINIFSAQYLIELQNYVFSFAKVVDFNSLIMGVVILIMNEVLRMAIEIKEEQELTI